MKTPSTVKEEAYSLREVEQDPDFMAF